MPQISDIHPLNRIVTSFFWVFEHPNEETVKLRPGLDLLAAALVRAAAHRLYIPYHTPRYGESIQEVIQRYPQSLIRRIEIVDKKRKTYDKVSLFLKPIYDEVRETPFIFCYNTTFDFLYKLALASKFQAEADVSQAMLVGYSIDTLISHLENEEAKIRLEELLGIFSLYQPPERINTFTILPQIPISSIYERISDLLDEGEIIELSRNRYLLGIPSKAKIAWTNIRKWKRNVLTKREYKNYIGAATDLIQVGATSIGHPFPLKGISEPLLNLLTSTSYNPPLIDLDYFRVEICKSVSPGHYPNFIMPDGATRAMSDEYFQRFYGFPPEN